MSCVVGVGGGTAAHSTLVLAGAAGLVGGALSMAVGEFISVSSQKDAELADVQRERDEQAKGTCFSSAVWLVAVRSQGANADISLTSTCH
jgi:VIT1/CCC1 family predicted Fe2+/Mn2+ transporter